MVKKLPPHPIDEKVSGKSTATNIGSEIAPTPALGFCDDDS